MFRTVGDQVSLWEAVLPAELLKLPDELARVDELLDDPVFFAPFVPFFDPRIGRPSTPMETYLRLMFLKFRYRLGYESLGREVSRFDHLAAVLPDPAGRGGAASDDVDEADHPVRRRRGGRAQRGAVGQGRRGQAVAHQPGSCGHHGGSGQCVLSDRFGSAGQSDSPDRRDRRRIQAAGGAVRTRVRDRSRAAGKRAHAIGAKLRIRAPRGPRARRRPRCGGSPGSWPSWPPPRPRGPAAAGQRQASAAPRPRRGRRTAQTWERDAAAGRRRGRLARAVDDLADCWRRPDRS